MLKCRNLYKILNVVSTQKRIYLSTTRMASFVSVRNVPDEERIQISFQLSPSNGGSKTRTLNMDRMKTEDLGKTIARMQCNVEKASNGKSKKKKAARNGDSVAGNTTEPVSSLCLLDPNGVQIDNNIPNSEAWSDGCALVIDGRNIKVRVNPPTVKGLSLCKCIMSGYPIYPSVDAEFIDLTHCQFVWYREVKKQEASANQDETQVTQPKKKPREDHEGSLEWEKVHGGSCYMPVNSDINSRIKLVCIPSNGTIEGEARECVSTNVVTAGPGFCPFENRHKFTENITGPDRLRMMSYNILADTYADSDFSRDHLFPYCPAYALTIDYRKQLLLKEIRGYNADVICLQEVDRKVFMHDLLPTLEEDGFSGHLKLKTGQVPEGTATFYRKSKFRLVGQHDIGMIQSIQEDPLYKDVLDKISTNEIFKEKMLERTTAVQVSVLESVVNPDRRVIVATTHLYFHPKAAHIRVLQTAVCLRHLETVIQQYTDKEGGRPAVIFCGDFNSYPEGGVHDLIANKYIPAKHADWFAGGKEEFLEEMDLTHSLELTNACGFPRYTNFVTGFSGCLDYIYVDKNQLEAAKVIPMPTHEEVTQYTALPNAVFPSDHIAIICDITWK